MKFQWIHTCKGGHIRGRIVQHQTHGEVNVEPFLALISMHLSIFKGFARPSFFHDQIHFINLVLCFYIPISSMFVTQHGWVLPLLASCSLVSPHLTRPVNVFSVARVSDRREEIGWALISSLGRFSSTTITLFSLCEELAPLPPVRPSPTRSCSEGRETSLTFWKY